MHPASSGNSVHGLLHRICHSRLKAQNTSDQAAAMSAGGVWWVSHAALVLCFARIQLGNGKIRVCPGLVRHRIYNSWYLRGTMNLSNSMVIYLFFLHFMILWGHWNYRIWKWRWLGFDQPCWNIQISRWKKHMQAWDVSHSRAPRFIFDIHW